MEQFHFLLHEREELHGVEFGQPAVFADFIIGGLEKVSAVHAGNLDRILEGEKHAFAGAFLGVECKQVLAAVYDFAASDVVAFAAGKDRGERALTAAVGAHDGVHFSGINREVDSFENLPAFHGGAQVLDGKNRLFHWQISVVQVRSAF